MVFWGGGGGRGGFSEKKTFLLKTVSGFYFLKSLHILCFENILSKSADFEYGITKVTPIAEIVSQTVKSDRLFKQDLCSSNRISH